MCTQHYGAFFSQIVANRWIHWQFELKCRLLDFFEYKSLLHVCCVCVGQRIACRTQVSPSTVCVLGSNLTESGLAKQASWLLIHGYIIFKPKSPRVPQDSAFKTTHKISPMP